MIDDLIAFLSITPEIDGWMFLMFTALSAFTSALGTVAGLGGGVLLIGVMATVFPPVALIPVHGVVQAGSNVTRSIIARKLIRKTAILPFAVGALIGASIGGKIVVGLPVEVMQAILGIFLLYICWSPQITVGKPTNGRFFVLGIVGAFVSMFIGATGSLLAPWVRGVSEDRREFVATLACIMMFVHGLKAVIFGFLGFAFMTYLPLMAAMVAAGFIGNWLGFKLLTVMREDVFKRLFQIALTVLSVRLLWSAAEKSGFF